MMYNNFRHGERPIQCPYDNTHMILAKSFNAHLIKCRNNHPGHKMVSCKFDKTHLIAKPELSHHYTECPSRYLLDREKQMYAERASNQQGLCGAVEGPKIVNSPNYDLLDEERWDYEEYQGGPQALFNKKPVKHENFEGASKGPNIPRSYYEPTPTNSSGSVHAQKMEEVSSRLPHGFSEDAQMAGSQKATAKAAPTSQVYEYSLMGRSGAGRGMAGRGGHQKAEPKVGIVSPLHYPESPTPSANGMPRGRGVAKYATNAPKVSSAPAVTQAAGDRGSGRGLSATGAPQRSLPASLLGSKEGPHRQQHNSLPQQHQQQRHYEITQEQQPLMDIQQMTSLDQGVTIGALATPAGRGRGQGVHPALTVLSIGRGYQAGLAGELQQQPVMGRGSRLTRGQEHRVMDQTSSLGGDAAPYAPLRRPVTSSLVQGLHTSTGSRTASQQEQEVEEENWRGLSETELAAGELRFADALQSQMDSAESERDDSSSVISSLSSRLASSSVSDVEPEDASEQSEKTSTGPSSKPPQCGKEMLENLLKAKRRTEKKLKQIERLEAKAAQGHILSEEETHKVKRKATVTQDLTRLKLALPNAEL